MADTRTPHQRRKIMQSVHAQHTGPELVVRRLLHGLGYRYRLHARSLPGRPDIAFTARRKAIFIHGCFWHGHGCRKGQAPKSRQEYWIPKIEANRTRDAVKDCELKELGWSVLSVWQCELPEIEAVRTKLVEFLGDPKNSDRHRA